jgi:uncharacterized membrane protein
MNRSRWITPLLLAAVAPLVALAWPNPASADFTVCNKTPSEVGVAVGYIAPEGFYVTSGYYRLAAHHCSDGPLVLSSWTSDPHNYFYWAKEYGSDYSWTGDIALCTDPKSFTIMGAQSSEAWCRDQGYNYKYFGRAYSPSGNHTLNLWEDNDRPIIDTGPELNPVEGD